MVFPPQFVGRETRRPSMAPAGLVPDKGITAILSASVDHRHAVLSISAVAGDDSIACLACVAHR